jgi:hypothetical protein
MHHLFLAKHAPIAIEATVARATYMPESLGTEIAAPSGYYTPIEERFLDQDGKRLLYVLGSACVETSCCGTGSWSYARAEGYVVEQHPPERTRGEAGGIPVEVETVEGAAERSAIDALLLERHPGVRIEFR